MIINYHCSSNFRTKDYISKYFFAAQFPSINKSMINIYKKND